MNKPTILVALLASTVPAGVRADTIVQSGEIMQLGETLIVLDQFDDMGGARELDSVQIDLYSSMHGGFTTSGNGTPVTITIDFYQDYYLDTELLVGTHCHFNDTLANQASAAYSFWIPQNEQTVIHQPPQLTPWIGAGQITVTSIGIYEQVADPPDGVLDMGAGLTGEYTFAYNYTVVVACPADVDGNGMVDVVDLLAVLSAWGNAGGSEDINGDGLVDVIDLLDLLSAWGPC